MSKRFLEQFGKAILEENQNEQPRKTLAQKKPKRVKSVQFEESEPTSNQQQEPTSDDLNEEDTGNQFNIHL